MILVIDNYDSFTYNLVQLMGEMGADLRVVRNDRATIDEIRAMQPSHIVISPGPGTPDDAGISQDVIRELGPTIPTLGVCLGQQSIGKVYGGRVVRAPRPFSGMRYHSLLVYEPLPDCLKVTAFTTEGEIMALEHKSAPVVGLQFHPESILTEHGKTILGNFLETYGGHYDPRNN